MDKKNVELHGGNVYKILREKNINVLDYSSNINPFGVPESLKKEIVNNFHVLEKYPDIEYVQLREKIAQFNKIKIENIIVGNGATEIIFLFMKILNVKKILIVSPTFAEYERGLNANITGFNNNVENFVEKIEINYFELEEKNNFNINIEKLEKEMYKNYDLLIICNPNNPTGTFINFEKMEQILKICNKTNTKMFVDEAFIEFVENGLENSIIKTNENKKNLFVVRAFTKFFAIPGLRLGYGICFDENLYNKINEIKEPWTVNNFAEIAGNILLEDKKYIEKTNNWIKIEKKYFYEQLTKIKGLKPYKTETNFILVKIEENKMENSSKNTQLNVQKLKEKMLEKGILIRDASNFKYLNDTFFRLAIKNRENNDILLEKLKEIFL